MFALLQRRVVLITLVALVSSAAAGVLVERWYARQQVQLERERVRAVMVPYAGLVSAAIGRRVAEMSGLKAFVASRRSSTQLTAEFPLYGAGVVDNHATVRAVQVVRNGRIAIVYPLSGNESAVGHDIGTDSRDETRLDYQRTMATDRVTLSGPIPLVQGGRGIILRQRVRTRYDTAVDLVALVIDLRLILHEMNIERPPAGIALQLLDRHRALVAASQPELPAEPEVVTAPVPDGDWELRGAPVEGWSVVIARRVRPLRLQLVSVVLLLTVLAYLLADRDARLQRAVDLRTTAVLQLVEARTATIRRLEASEAALAANEDRLRQALAAARMATFEIDVRAQRVRWSPEIGSMHGLALGGTPVTIEEAVLTFHRDDRRAAIEAFQAAGRAPTTGAMQYRTRGDDGLQRWLHATWISRVGPDGAVDRIFGTVTDVTERKRLEEQFLHAQKMEAVGSLAGGIAHDFNNLLTVILGAGQMARSAAAELPGAEDLCAEVDEIIRAGERGSVLTGQLLAFSRRREAKLSRFDLGELVVGMSSMLKRLVGERIELQSNAGQVEAPVFADHGQMSQVVMNLAVNARDAMSAGGTMRIDISTEQRSGQDAALVDGLAPGRYVRLAVRDTGVGIDPSVAHMVFDPFFTTKPTGQGTGLGLSMAHEIAAQARGAVRFVPNPGGGTIFEVFVPYSDAVADATAVSEAPSLARSGGRRTILVAEDEEGLRRLVSRILTDDGFDVLLATDGEAALRVARGHDGPIDLLLSDVVMPKLGGLELASVLKQEHPATRVLLMSGYPERASGERVEVGDTPFLAKPFTPAQLRDAVHDALT